MFFALNDAILVFLSKGISLILDTSIDYRYTRVLFEYIAYVNAERSDSTDVSCGRLLVAVFAVRTSYTSEVLTLCLPLAQVHVSCYARLLIVRALVAALYSARFPSVIQSFSAVSGACSSDCLLLERRIIHEDDSR